MQRIFPLINHRQSANTQPTHPPCLCDWLASFRLLSLQGMSGQGWPAKKSTYTEQKASFCDPPHHPGDKSWGHPLVPAGSQYPGLSAPTLLEGSPWLFKHGKGLPAIASRQAKFKSFPPNSTPFPKMPKKPKKTGSFSSERNLDAWLLLSSVKNSCHCATPFRENQPTECWTWAQKSWSSLQSNLKVLDNFYP